MCSGKYNTTEQAARLFFSSLPPLPLVAGAFRCAGACLWRVVRARSQRTAGDRRIRPTGFRPLFYGLFLTRLAFAFLHRRTRPMRSSTSERRKRQSRGSWVQAQRPRPRHREKSSTGKKAQTRTARTRKWLSIFYCQKEKGATGCGLCVCVWAAAAPLAGKKIASVRMRTNRVMGRFFPSADKYVNGKKKKKKKRKKGARVTDISIFFNANFLPRLCLCTRFFCRFFFRTAWYAHARTTPLISHETLLSFGPCGFVLSLLSRARAHCPLQTNFLCSFFFREEKKRNFLCSVHLSFSLPGSRRCEACNRFAVAFSFFHSVALIARQRAPASFSG